MDAVTTPAVGGARHPRGLAVLAGTELAERFSYYGMTALLALYMTKQLLLPGHAENVIGLSAVRTLLEWRGPMSNQAFASLIYGWYGGLVYFTPLIGGYVADRWLGKKRTVVLGALLMTGGHLAMSRDETFLIALLLLILGSGCLKGNISAQVGTLYGPHEESRRARGFTLFSTGINIGALTGPLATGGLATTHGWHAGFALAAVMMVAAMILYLAGQRSLPPTPPRGRSDTKVTLSPAEWRRTKALAIVVLLNVPAQMAYMMIWSIGVLWVDQRFNLSTPFGDIPASWFNSVDSLAAIAGTAPLIALWSMQARRGSEPASLTKVAIGSTIIGLGALLLAAGALVTPPAEQISVWWALAGWMVMGFGFMWYWPTTLAIVSHAAPPSINSTLVSASFLALFISSVLMGWVGSYFEEMSNPAFWTMDAAIAFTGAMVLFAARKPLQRALSAGLPDEAAPVSR